MQIQGVSIVSTNLQIIIFFCFIFFRFVSSVVSPHLLCNEFKRLDNAFKTFDNMVVKTRPGAREVVAVYTIEEISMELVVKLSSNHPLSPVSVECGKRIGVTTSLWRQWMLQLTTFLSFQVIHTSRNTNTVKYL